jgi:GMP synthase-like glutamine amidotransferase
MLALGGRGIIGPWGGMQLGWKGCAMARVLILQFMNDDAPAYLGTWLRRRGIDADLRVARGDASSFFPERIEGYGALALLGGSMSVNDDLVCLRVAERLVEQAMQRDVPVLGHCLGGQLMARALGAKVAASPAPEIGWQRIACAEVPQRQHWFGPASSPACRHQAFAIGPHLALQFHVEVDAAKVALWLSQGESAYLEAQRHHDSVHGEQRVRDDTSRYLAAQQRLADRIYDRWLGSAKPVP